MPKGRQAGVAARCTRYDEGAKAAEKHCSLRLRCDNFPPLRSGLADSNGFQPSKFFPYLPSPSQAGRFPPHSSRKEAPAHAVNAHAFSQRFWPSSSFTQPSHRSRSTPPTRLSRRRKIRRRTTSLRSPPISRNFQSRSASTRRSNASASNSSTRIRISKKRSRTPTVINSASMPNSPSTSTRATLSTSRLIATAIS